MCLKLCFCSNYINSACSAFLKLIYFINAQVNLIIYLLETLTVVSVHTGRNQDTQGIINDTLDLHKCTLNELQTVHTQHLFFLSTAGLRDLDSMLGAIKS